MKLSWNRVFLFLLLLFIAGAVLYPDSFGNNPDIIQDESYFLTSSLASIQKHTLPGWEFSPSGAYYGGIQTYLDTVAMMPVVAYAVISAHFSLLQAQVQLALHTGDLLHVLRLVNGILIVGVIGSFFWYFSKRKIPRLLAWQLLFVLFLLLGNSIVIGLLHTAKVWSIALLIETSIGILFLANEYFVSRFNTLFIPQKTYVMLMVWGVVLAFFQDFVGVFTAGLWFLYAIALGHFPIRDVIGYLKKHWYIVAIFSLTQISFFCRGIIARVHPSLLDYAGNSTRDPTGGIDWLHRLYDPVINALWSEPLVILYPIGIILTIVWAMRDTSFLVRTRDRIFVVIAIINPLLTFLFYYGILGFSLFPRYSLPLAAACSFSAAMLLVQSRKVLAGALVLSGAVFAVVSLQSIELFWQPSSAVMLERTIAARYNSPDNVFIIEPASLRLALPINDRSLALLNDRRKALTRFTFLSRYPTLVHKDVSFAPIILFADTAQEERSYLNQFGNGTSSVWTITQDCARMCAPKEVQEGSCFAINAPACDAFSPDDQKEYPVLLLSDFLSQSQLGITYIAHKVWSAKR